MKHPSLTLLETEAAQFSTLFPESEFPPQCFRSMETEFLEYESRSMLKVQTPVHKKSLNPMQGMQGGFIAAAFDNTFGPLSYFAARNPCVTLDLHINYIRPIKEGDIIIVTARVVSRGQSSLHLSAEAVNSKGKLIATGTTNLIVAKEKTASK